jgi:hypothetical protein
MKIQNFWSLLKIYSSIINPNKWWMLEKYLFNINIGKA